MATTRAKHGRMKSPKCSAGEQGVEVDSGKCRETEPVSGQCTTEAILSPETVKAMQRIQSGKTINLRHECTVTVTLPEAALVKIHAFLRTGGHKHLAELLRTFPEAISHPGVAREIRHLRAFLRPQEEREGLWPESKYSCGPDDPECG